MEKAVIALQLAIIHVFVECSPDEILDARGLPYFFDSIAGGPFAAPMFMFAMGIGLQFISEHVDRYLLRRGIKLLALAFGLNVCRYLVPSLIGFLPKGGCTALAVLEPDEFDDLPESYRYRNETIQLQPGDMLFQYTDGVTEATDAQEELFGDERLLDTMNGAGDDAPEKLLPYVRKKIDEFVKDAPQFDDITMLGLRYLG